MDGISTASLLRERFDIPSIFLSGASSAALLARARSVQPPGFIHKPFMPDDIERAVSAAFESGATAGFDDGNQSDRAGNPSDRER
jgi:DNA-binding NarL/FixJ family response regulator